MKRGILTLLFCVFLLLCGCGQKNAPETLPEEGLTELAEVQTAPSHIPAEDVTCTVLEREGKVSGFEMRFRQSTEADELFRSEKNYYYGVLTNDKKVIPVPTESIRILTDIETKSFVVTLLLPTGQSLSGKNCAVSLCVAEREKEESGVLFCVTKDVSLP